MFVTSAMTQTADSHDARRTLSELRDHLARHDKPLGFFFGAGTSCSVRIPVGDLPEIAALIPDVAELTARCYRQVTAMGEPFASAWDGIRQLCEAERRPMTVEDFLSRLRIMALASTEMDRLAGMTKDQIISLEKVVRELVGSAANPGSSG